MAQYDTQYTTLPEPAPRRARWPLASVMLLDLAIIFVALLASAALIQAVALTVYTLNGNLLPPEDELITQLPNIMGVGGIFATLLVQNLLFVCVPIVRVAILRREPLAEIGFQAPNIPKLVGLGISLSLITLFCNAILSLAFQGVGIQQNQSAQYPLFENDYFGQFFFFIGAALIVPIGEEILFRGYVFNALRTTFQSKSWGIALAFFISALLFSAAHSLSATEGLIGLLVPTFVMGLLFAGATYISGSILPSIIAHTINNSLGLSVLIYCVNNATVCQGL